MTELEIEVLEDIQALNLEVKYTWQEIAQHAWGMDIELTELESKAIEAAQ